MSVNTAGVHALIRYQRGLDFTSASLKMLKWRFWLCSRGFCCSSTLQSSVLNSVASKQPDGLFHRKSTVLSPQPVFLSLTLHPCGPECRTSPTNQVWPLTYKYAHIHSSWCGYKKMHQEEGRSKYRTWKRCQRALLLNLALTKQNMQMWVEAIRWWNHLIWYILTTAC